MTELAYVNGIFGLLADARVSIEDRGFQFGDGVYEVIAVYDGRPFLLERHMRRLRRSAASIGLVYDFDGAPLEPIITEGLSRSGLAGAAMVYIQLTRGACSRSHVIPGGLEPTVVMTFKPMPEVSDHLRQHGARLMTIRDTRWSNCYIKAITLLPNVLAKKDALDGGYDDAVFVTDSGEVRECSSANLFIVSRGGIKIPPRTRSILHGVTQGFLIECAAGLGLAVEEQAFDVASLLHADEAFMSSTTVEALAVTSVDDHSIGDGRVGPTTRRLYEEFRVRSRAMTAGVAERPLAGSSGLSA